MIYSMTAYANVEGPSPRGRLVWELRSVNHRFLELSFRMPEEFRALEGKLRERIEQRLSRGKIDINLRYRGAPLPGRLVLDRALLDSLSQLEREVAAAWPDSVPASRFEVLSYPGLVTEAELDQSSLYATALALFDQALDEFIATRGREGERLQRVLIERLDAIATIVVEVRALLPEIRAALRQRLEARLGELHQPVDPGRLEQELVMYAQKLDVDEELDRLTAHIAETRQRLDANEPVGRRLDFLLQEFNRESNTLGSKSVDTRTTQASVELKVLIEQLREQIQNIE
ncbi:MAG: YicC/YloC family endoribonuclease [Lysobacterales bacterium]